MHTLCHPAECNTITIVAGRGAGPHSGRGPSQRAPPRVTAGAALPGGRHRLRERRLIDLCARCGLCCDGTLYNYVSLVPDDLPPLAKYPQLALKVRDHQETFDLGCALHTGTGCSAYADRPSTCSRYVCGVLRAVARDELTEHEAVLVIEEAVALTANVKEYVAFEPGMPMAVSTWDAPPEGIEEDARLAWVRAARHLFKHFLGAEFPEPDAAAPEAEPPPGAGAIVTAARR